jgi:hypothetical protein
MFVARLEGYDTNAEMGRDFPISYRIFAADEAVVSYRSIKLYPL